MQANEDGVNPPVADELLDAVLDASRALVALSARSIADEDSVTLPQFRMLVVLQREPTSLTALAHALDVAPSTALRMVDRLVAGDLVNRSTAQHDRRESRLEITAAGARTVKRVLARRRSDLQTILSHVPSSRRQTVAKGMAAFAIAAEPILHPRSVAHATAGAAAIS